MLPLELIELIWNFLTPDEIVPFALTCRKIYGSSGQERLRSHKDLRKQHSKIVINFYRPFDTLDTYVDDVWKAYYPRHVVFTHGSGRSSQNDPRVKSLEIARKISFPKKNLEDYYRDDIIAALAIWLLPNVESINMNTSDHPFASWIADDVQMPKTLVNQIILGTNRMGAVALQKFSTIIARLSTGYLVFQNSETDSSKSLMTIPSRKVIESKAWDDNMALSPRAPCAATDLVLIHSPITAPVLESLLDHIKGITSLEYRDSCRKILTTGFDNSGMCENWPKLKPKYGASSLGPARI